MVEKVKFNNLDDIVDYVSENFDVAFTRFLTRMASNKDFVRKMAIERVKDNYDLYGVQYWNHPLERTLLDIYEEGADGPVYECIAMAGGGMCNDIHEHPEFNQCES